MSAEVLKSKKHVYFLQPSQIRFSTANISEPEHASKKTDFVSKDLDRTKINSGWTDEQSGKFDEMKA
jgi:hypothetical protein